MHVQDFKTGVTYRIRTAKWEAPTGQIIPGKEIVRRILESANQTNSSFEDDQGPVPEHVIKEWRKLLRVQDPGNGKVHLLDPRTFESAEEIQ